ncbi:MAG: 7-cyano-7-deazaguanine synthase QueC [Deltaproteobacteria bacterium]|nr:7-cyano-7-deazaguanine synthase QueC [Deltaproteobacteria bacterium]
MDPQKALVIFSGGQDSTTCLGWAKNRYPQVEALSIDYGQKHRVELTQAAKIARRLGVAHHVLEAEFFGRMVKSALTHPGDVGGAHQDHPGLPASFVPNRNAFFLTLAHAWAQTAGAGVLVMGVSQTDYSGYPDCREEFITAMGRALNLGAEVDIVMEAPLLHLTKAQTFALAQKEGVLAEVLELSHTCYNGVETMNPWGRGCGDCPACGLRRKGWEEYTAAL